MISRALARKELRQLLPWIVTLLVVEHAYIAASLALQAPDETVWVDSAPIFDSTVAQMRSGSLWVWALVFAYAGFPREQDEQTLPFLFSLPLSRARLFVTKAVVAGTVLSGAVLLGELERWLLQTANPTSFGSHAFRWDWALASALCTVAVAWICLGYSLFLALFRRLGLLLCALSWTLLLLAERADPSLRALNPLGLLHFEFVFSSAVVPWLPLAGHAAASSVCAALAGFVWVGPTEVLTAWLDRAMTSTATKWLFGLGLLATVTLFVWLLAKSSESAAEFGELRELEAPEAVLETRRYRFRYPDVLRPRLERLTVEADSLHDTLAERLGAPPPAGKILVNLLRTSPSHAGSATWEAIRMDLKSTSNDDELRRTFVHETAHVVALRASDRRIEGDALRFFDEGLAEYLSLELAADPAVARKRRLQAALAHSRLRIGFSELVDARAFGRRFAPASVYPLGFTWLEALVATCGGDAPRRLLATLAAGGLHRDVSDEGAFRALLQSARCELDQVNSHWGRELAARTEEWQAELGRVPTLVGGALHRDADGELVLRAELEGPALDGAVYRVTARPGPDALAEEAVMVSSELTASGGLEFFVDEALLNQGSLSFQFSLSWLSRGDYVEHHQEWRQTQLTQ